MSDVLEPGQQAKDYDRVNYTKDGTVVYLQDPTPGDESPDGTSQSVTVEDLFNKSPAASNGVTKWTLRDPADLPIGQEFKYHKGALVWYVDDSNPNDFGRIYICLQDHIPDLVDTGPKGVPNNNWQLLDEYVLDLTRSTGAPKWENNKPRIRLEGALSWYGNKIWQANNRIEASDDTGPPSNANPNWDRIDSKYTKNIMEIGVAPWVAGYERPKGSLIFHNGVVYETLVEITGNDVNIPPTAGNLYQVYNTNSIYPTDVWRNNRVYNYGDKATHIIGGVKFSFVSIRDNNGGVEPAFYGGVSSYWASTSHLAKYPAGEITPWFGNDINKIPDWVKVCSGSVVTRTQIPYSFDRLLTYLRNIARIVSSTYWNYGDKQTLFGYSNSSHSDNTPLNQITGIRIPRVADSVIGMSQNQWNLRLLPSVIPICEDDKIQYIERNGYDQCIINAFGTWRKEYQDTLSPRDVVEFESGGKTYWNLKRRSVGRFQIQDPNTAQVWPDRVMGYPVVNVAAIF